MASMEKVELKIFALSHSITQANSYAVVLEEVEGNRRLPIVIGGFEAQSIAVALEKMTPSRPLTHDLIKNICGTVKIELTEIIINNLVDGVFYAQLICKMGNETIEIDSRTSDALALAVRFECPIYTYEFIMETAGLLLDDLGEEIEAGDEDSEEPRKKVKAKVSEEDLNELNIDDLNDQLQEALEKEDYERAIRVRDEIDRRKKDS
jgi:bifunctional DNase/RNase